MTENNSLNEQNFNLQIKPQSKFRKIFLPVIGVLLLFSFLFFLQTDNVGQKKGKYKSVKAKPTKSLVPTSAINEDPFAELTIPYLREKKYESKLNERELLNNNGSYRSYLTSYLSDGLKVNGLLTIPNGETPAGGWPAIVFIHGYIPPEQYSTNGAPYSSYVDYLARNNFVVFKIDLRGHGNSEGEPGGGYFGSDYVTDTLNAYSALQNTDFVNSQKIGLWGHSMAGNTILRSIVIKKDLPAAVIWAGAVYTYTDMQKYSINDSSYQPPQNQTERQNKRRALFEKHGSPSAQSKFWQTVAPINFLSELKSVISIHHAVDDAVVNIGYSRDLVDYLKTANVEHEFYEYDSGGHNISGASFTLAMQRTVEFFNKQFKSL